MAMKLKHNEVEFGVGDLVKVFQRIKEGDKSRLSFFEGIVIKISGESTRKTFTVRRVGEASIGIEKIFPVSLPTIEKIEVVKKGLRGVRRSKLYYLREKSPKEIELIYSRNKRREAAKLAKNEKVAKKSSRKKTPKK